MKYDNFSPSLTRVEQQNDSALAPAVLPSSGFKRPRFLFHFNMDHKNEQIFNLALERRRPEKLIIVAFVPSFENSHKICFAVSLLAEQNRKHSEAVVTRLE